KGSEKLDEARQSVIVPVEAKYWGRLESRQTKKEDAKRSDKDDASDTSTGMGFDDQCLEYMSLLHKNYGILTDGKTWRIYNRDLSDDAYRRHYQFNLGYLINHVQSGLDKKGNAYREYVEHAKYFFHLFGKHAFVS